MAHITTVDVTAGVPTAGTGTVYTLDGIINTEDNASANGDIGIVTLAKRSATPANTSDTDGDYEPLQVSNGKLWVQGAGLYNAGTNGFIATLTLTSGADLASLGSGSAATLSGGGSAGVSTQTNTASGKYGYIEFKTATAGFTPTAGGCISIWFLAAMDGTNFETTPATPSTTVPALARAPDCIIPLDAAALGTSAIKISPRCKLPEHKFKVLVQNNSGAAFGAGNYIMTLYVAEEKN